MSRPSILRCNLYELLGIAAFLALMVVLFQNGPILWAMAGSAIFGNLWCRVWAEVRLEQHEHLIHEGVEARRQIAMGVGNEDVSRV